MFDGVLSLADQLVNLWLILQKPWLYQSVVDQEGAAIVAWNHEPEKKGALGQCVEWNPEEQLVAEELQEAEQRVDNPVHEPFGVVLAVRRLDGFDWLVGRPGEADQVAHEVIAEADDQIESNETDQTFVWKRYLINSFWTKYK